VPPAILIDGSASAWGIVVAPDTPALQVIQSMLQRRLNITLVVGRDSTLPTLLGLFTEQEAWPMILSAKEALEAVAIASLMAPVPPPLTEETLAHPQDCLAQFKLHNVRYLPVVNAQNVLVGLLMPEHCYVQLGGINTATANPENGQNHYLAIAIHQSRLYEQVRQLNLTLEQQVQHHTSELQQSLLFGDLLRRITDRVRESLDEQQILQNVVKELAEALNTHSCDTGLYDLERQTSTIFCEYLRSEINMAQGVTFAMDDHPHIYPLLLAGHAIQFCWTNPPLRAVRSQVERFSVLACPVIDDQEVIGDMWVYRPCNDYFEEAEVRLVQQVGNQCAIAIRQSRLYQAAKYQVEELARLNYLKDDFLSSVSHELRTPMSNIKMATQMLEDILGEHNLLDDITAPIPRYFQIIKEECQRELSLINDLLDLSRLDAGTEPLLLSTLSLEDWLHDQIEPFREQAQQQQQQLLLDIPTGLPPLTTDFSYLGRILTELLENACKYTLSGETIRVSTTATLAVSAKQHAGNLPYLLLEVSNSGVEIPAAETEKIFDRFYRIPSHDPWRYGGTGLGLALVKKLTEQIQATITVECQNGWNCFRVKLPLEITG
jgi:signal transduction histidine kinase